MKIKVSKLEGPLLAEFVARVLGWKLEYLESGIEIWNKGDTSVSKEAFRPDINGGQAMELVEKFKVNILWNEALQYWICTIRNLPATGDGIGEIPEIAISRAVVAFKFGEYVEVSDENITNV